MMTRISNADTTWSFLYPYSIPEQSKRIFGGKMRLQDGERLLLCRATTSEELHDKEKDHRAEKGNDEAPDAEAGGSADTK